jgi:hypothetical protein
LRVSEGVRNADIDGSEALLAPSRVIVQVFFSSETVTTPLKEAPDVTDIGTGVYEVTTWV